MDSDSPVGSGRLTRRTFLSKTAAATAGFMIVPRHVLGGPGYKAPSDTLNVACVGVSGMGRVNVAEMASENIVALCDVDPVRSASIFEKYPDAAVFTDFRVMLESRPDIDAVIVATPDHTHAIVSLAAMQLGKHVYTQKPLTRHVAEARILAQAAEKYGVVAQMGNQHHSSERFRAAAEWIWDGAIGDVREAHVWTDRPIWPQGIPTPTTYPPMPDELAWDLFIGPSAMRPYHPLYHPFSWRGWWDFGTGALGDIGCHSIDFVYYALKLDQPASVRASNAKPMGEEDPHDVFPRASLVYYDFPAREEMPAVKLTWYDGGLLPSLPEHFGPDRKLPDGGILFVGDKGMLTFDGDEPRLLPDDLHEAYQRPAKTLPRIETSHEMNFVDACKGLTEASSPFSYAGPLTETVLLGNLAVRYPNETLAWDAKAMRVTNNAEADAYVRGAYRPGWELVL